MDSTLNAHKLPSQVFSICFFVVCKVLHIWEDGVCVCVYWCMSFLIVEEKGVEVGLDIVFSYNMTFNV